MATIKGLAQSNFAQVFRLVESTMKKDATLRMAVDRWQSASAKPADKAPFGKAARVAITLRPSFGACEFYGAQAIRGALEVNFVLEVEGGDDDDFMNLWLAIKRSLYPQADAARSAIRQALVAAGADTGEVLFVDPPQDAQPAPADGRWAAVGKAQIQVIETLTGNAPR